MATTARRCCCYVPCSFDRQKSGVGDDSTIYTLDADEVFPGGATTQLFNIRFEYSADVGGFSVPPSVHLTIYRGSVDGEVIYDSNCWPLTSGNYRFWHVFWVFNVAPVDEQIVVVVTEECPFVPVNPEADALRNHWFYRISCRYIGLGKICRSQIGGFPGGTMVEIDGELAWDGIYETWDNSYGTFTHLRAPKFVALGNTTVVLRLVSENISLSSGYRIKPNVNGVDVLWDDSSEWLEFTYLNQASITLSAGDVLRLFLDSPFGGTQSEYMDVYPYPLFYFLSECNYKGTGQFGTNPPGTYAKLVVCDGEDAPPNDVWILYRGYPDGYVVRYDLDIQHFCMRLDFSGEWTDVIPDNWIDNPTSFDSCEECLAGWIKLQLCDGSPNPGYGVWLVDTGQPDGVMQHRDTIVGVFCVFLERATAETSATEPVAPDVVAVGEPDPMLDCATCLASLCLVGDCGFDTASLTLTGSIQFVPYYWAESETCAGNDDLNVDPAWKAENLVITDVVCDGGDLVITGTADTYTGNSGNTTNYPADPPWADLVATTFELRLHPDGTWDFNPDVNTENAVIQSSTRPTLTGMAGDCNGPFGSDSGCDAGIGDATREIVTSTLVVASP